MLNANCIDPWVFSAEKQTACYSFSLAQLDQRVLSGSVLLNPQDTVQATFIGGKTAQNQAFIDVHLSAVLQMTCQRCLKTMDFTLNETIRTLLCENETVADRLENQLESADTLVVEQEISITEWIEDQLLTALPFAPTHNSCETAISPDNNQTNPFAVLKNLK